MIRNAVSTFLVALHEERLDFPWWDAGRRSELLADLMNLDVSAISVGKGRLVDRNLTHALSSFNRHWRGHGAAWQRAVESEMAAILRGVPSAQAYRFKVIHDALRRAHELVAEGVGELAAAGRAPKREREARARVHFEDSLRIVRPLIRNRVEVGVACLPPAELRLEMRRAIRLPVELVYEPSRWEGQVALAVMEEMAGARSSGRCVACGKWWTSQSARRRKTCPSNPTCDQDRKAEWRRRHPEPVEQVAERVRKWRSARRSPIQGPGVGNSHVGSRL